MSEIDRLRTKVGELEREVAWKRRRARLLVTSLLVTLVSIPSLIAWNVVFADAHAALVAGRGFLGTALAVGGLTAAVICVDHLIQADPLVFRTGHSAPHRYAHSLAELRDLLVTEREELRMKSLRAHPPLTDRRSLYREDTAEVIVQLGRESRHYRRVHNSLQSLIIIGSTAMTTLAATGGVSNKRRIC